MKFVVDCDDPAMAKALAEKLAEDVSVPIQGVCAVCCVLLDAADLVPCADCRLVVCKGCWDKGDCCAAACGSCWQPMSVCGHFQEGRRDDR